MNNRKIYLAGGFNSGWQQIARDLLPGYHLLDPSQHDLADPLAYTAWDLRAVQECDILLANMEESNPAGYALSLEIGYAKALGKQILFVDQVNDPKRSRYFEMIRQVADRVFPSLQQAADFLNKGVGICV
jgi:nucleoside 2-deoxyribosyltransferase